MEVAVDGLNIMFWYNTLAIMLLSKMFPPHELLQVCV